MSQFLSGTRSIWDAREDKRASGWCRRCVLALVLLRQRNFTIVRTERLGRIVRPAEHAHARWTLSLHAVGLEINANHLRAKRDGIVRCVATPIHRGRSTQVWTATITDEQDRPICTGRCTLAVVPVR